MPIQTEIDYTKHHHRVMDQIIKDYIASLKGERMVHFLPYQPKNIIKQMSALHIEMDALHELIEMETITSEMVEDQNF